MAWTSCRAALLDTRGAEKRNELFSAEAWNFRFVIFDFRLALGGQWPAASEKRPFL
jgi:hypothetical protein